MASVPGTDSHFICSIYFLTISRAHSEEAAAQTVQTNVGQDGFSITVTTSTIIVFIVTNTY